MGLFIIFFAQDQGYDPGGSSPFLLRGFHTSHEWTAVYNHTELVEKWTCLINILGER